MSSDIEDSGDLDMSVLCHVKV